MHRVNKSLIVSALVAILFAVGVGTSTAGSGGIPIHSGTPAGCPLARHILPGCTIPGGPLELALTVPSRPADSCSSGYTWETVQVSNTIEYTDGVADYPITIDFEETAQLQQGYSITLGQYCHVFRSVGAYTAESDGNCRLVPGYIYIPSLTGLIRTSDGVTVTSHQANIDHCDTLYFKYTGNWTDSGGRCYRASAADYNNVQASTVESPQGCD